MDHRESREYFVRNVRVKAINSCTKPKLPPGQTVLSFPGTKGVCSFSILLILTLSSCMKNSREERRSMGERDTVARIQELRDSLSRFSMRSKGVAPREKISSDTMFQKKASALVDTIVGSVYVSGNEPFTRLTLALEDGRSAIVIRADSNLSRQLLMIQGRVVRIIGRIVKTSAGDYVCVNEYVIVQ